MLGLPQDTSLSLEVVFPEPFVRGQEIGTVVIQRPSSGGVDMGAYLRLVARLLAPVHDNRVSCL